MPENPVLERVLFSEEQLAKRVAELGRQISAAEAEGLLENMKKCKDGMHCPHGRPCVAQLKMKEVDKLFGR